MCGIAGILRYNSVDISRDINFMRDSFPYRGPDDKGTWADPDGKVALGHRRLSILDPTPAGHQPMHDAQHGLVIVFNGEIYNYIEIKQELIKKGHVFATGTDTEVILKAFAQWGIACLDQFNGMFAFVIWQKKTQQLFLARDRLGIKPLYYYEDNAGFYFASETKAIQAVLREQPPVEIGLIDAYMSFGYVPGENTMLKGVKRLMPGHFMIKDANRASIDKYWDLNFDNIEDRGETYYLEKANALLDNAIDLRLRSDVPLGFF